MPVDRWGRLDLDAFAAAVRAPGVAARRADQRQPRGRHGPAGAEAAAAACAAAGRAAATSTRPSRWAGCPVPEGWSLLPASAHKWGGPPGVGLLVVRKGTRWESPYPADEREAGRARGANLPVVVAAAAALRAAVAEAAGGGGPAERPGRPDPATVAATVPDVEVVGDPVDRLPHLVTFSCLYVDGEALLHALDRRGFAVSSVRRARVDAAPQPRAGGDGGAVARQRPGVAAPGDDRGGDRSVPGRVARNRG